MAKFDQRKCVVRGNSYISSVGYKDGLLSMYQEIHPHMGKGDATTWYWVDGAWKSWGWFNAWDESQYLPDTFVRVHLCGGGCGKEYFVDLYAPAEGTYNGYRQVALGTGDRKYWVEVKQDN